VIYSREKNRVSKIPGKLAHVRRWSKDLFGWQSCSLNTGLSTTSLLSVLLADFSFLFLIIINLYYACSKLNAASISTNESAAELIN
jgi:hypothetical protein